MLASTGSQLARVIIKASCCSRGFTLMLPGCCKRLMWATCSHFCAMAVCTLCHLDALMTLLSSELSRAT